MIPIRNQPRGARLATVLALAACLLCLLAPAAAQAQAAAPAHTPGGEVNIKLPSLEQGEFFGLNGHQFLLGGLAVCVLGLLLRPLDLPRRAQAARPPFHGRDLGAHLRDLQGLPHPAGQAPARPRALHRDGHRRLFLDDRIPVLSHRHHPRLQPDRHGRQLRGRLVRHPDQHPGQLPHRLRQPHRQALSRLRHPAARGHERRA